MWWDKPRPNCWDGAGRLMPLAEGHFSHGLSRQAGSLVLQPFLTRPTDSARFPHRVRHNFRVVYTPS